MDVVACASFSLIERRTWSFYNLPNFLSKPLLQTLFLANWIHRVTLRACLSFLLYISLLCWTIIIKAKIKWRNIKWLISAFIRYFLLNKDLARRTNLFFGSNRIAARLYNSLLNEIRVREEIQSSSLDATVKEALNLTASRLNRKLEKTLYMSLVSGKTQHSAAFDIQARFHHQA